MEHRRQDEIDHRLFIKCNMWSSKFGSCCYVCLGLEIAWPLLYYLRAGQWRSKVLQRPNPPEELRNTSKRGGCGFKAATFSGRRICSRSEVKPRGGKRGMKGAQSYAIHQHQKRPRRKHRVKKAAGKTDQSSLLPQQRGKTEN